MLVACSPRSTLPPPTLPLTPSPDAPFRATPPALETTALDPPEVRSAELSNGMHVLVVERPDLPLVTLAWASHAARDSGAPHEAGLAALTVHALREGTRFSDGRELAHVRINGEPPQIWVGNDGTVIGIHTPAAGLSVGVDTLAATVRRPILAPAGVEAGRAEQLEALVLQSTGVGYQLRDAALLGLFGEKHPSVGALGRHADVVTYTPDMVSRFHATHYAPESSALLAVGAVTLEQVVLLAERHFGDWVRSGTPAPPTTPVHPLERSRPIQGLSGAGQRASVALALPCPPASDAREADFDVLGMVLANLPLSRATRQLRHGESMAYPVTARCEATRGRGTFWVEFAVEPERVGDALAMVLGQIGRLRTEDVPQAELDLAKIQLLGRVGGELSTNAGITRMLANVFLRGEPPEALARWVRDVQGATSARMRESARLYLTGRIGVATYGRRDLIEVGLARFGATEWSMLR